MVACCCSSTIEDDEEDEEEEDERFDMDEEHCTIPSKESLGKAAAKILRFNERTKIEDSCLDSDFLDHNKMRTVFFLSNCVTKCSISINNTSFLSSSD